MSELLKAADRHAIVLAVQDEASRVTYEARVAFQWMVAELARPSVLFRPRVYLDGDKWCALYGDDIQTGVAGFGDSPAKATADFDNNWALSIKSKPSFDDPGPEVG